MFYCYVTVLSNLLLYVNKSTLQWWDMNKFALQCKEAKKQERNCSFSGDRLNQNNHDKAINIKFIALECRQIKSVRPKILTEPIKLTMFNHDGLI